MRTLHRQTVQRVVPETAQLSVFEKECVFILSNRNMLCRHIVLLTWNNKTESRFSKGSGFFNVIYGWE